jgi:hypothetical protein
MILGLETRILPMHAWYWAFADAGFQRPVVAPQAMGSQTLRMLVFYLWLWGVPALALGFFTNRSAVVGAGAWALLAGVILAAFNTTSVLAHVIGHRSHRAPVG